MRAEAMGSTRAARQILVGALSLLLVSAVYADDRSDSILIRDATLIDGTGAKPRSGSDILVRGDRVVSIGPDIETPPGAREIDATGKFVVPGLIDTHVHLNFPVVFQVTDDEKRAIVEHTPLAFLYNGVTTVLNVSSDADWIWAKREQQRRGDLVAPRIFATGHSFTPENGWGSRHGGALSSAAAAKSKALEYVEANTDGFKIVIEDGLGGSGTYREMPEDMLQAIVAVARQHDVPLYVHAINLSEFRRAADIGAKAIVHGLEDPLAPEDPLLDELAAKEIAVVPTLSLFRSFLKPDPQAGAELDHPVLEGSVPNFLLTKMRDPAYMKLERQNFIDASARMDAYGWAESRNPVFCENVAKMHEAGVTIAVGTDGGGTVGYNFQGYNTPWEVKLLVECGLTPMEAIVAATKNGAKVIGVSDELGTVEVDKLADMLILSANPLRNIENIRLIDTVIQAGQVHDREYFAYKGE